MKRIKAIVLCAGKANREIQPTIATSINSLAPINGKPVIGWIIDDLLSKRIEKITVVINKNQNKIKRYISSVYKMESICVTTTHGSNINESIKDGLKKYQKKGKVLIILGDTLINENTLNLKESCAFISLVDNPKKWCVVETDDLNYIVQYKNKKSSIPAKKSKALAGYYYFSNSNDLNLAVNKAINKKLENISDVLKEYGKKNKIKAISTKNWFDFGNIENFLKAKRNLFLPRFFNSIKVDGNLNILYKKSFNIKKLEDEYNWYKKIPKNLQPFTPRIISFEKNKKSAEITQEYYGYPTLSELFIFSDFDAEMWKIIIKKILMVHEEFRKNKSKINRIQINKMYYLKTINRLEKSKINKDNKKIIQQKKLILNNKIMKGYSELKEDISKFSNELSENFESSIIHGDFCFSNILFDFSSQIVKLIDPRGSFGKKSIFGDPRYDIAKLRHSLSGGYDYIKSNMFVLKKQGEGFSLKIDKNKKLNSLSRFFDMQISKNGYNENEIKFIEGILFLSMVPLHDDKPDHQLAFYLIGIEILNEVFNYGKSI